MNEELNKALDDIRNKFGDEAIMMLDDSPRVDVDAISTGSISLDIALGVGGIPKGRVIELFGPESSGKTTVALHIAAEAQKMGGVAAFIDAEHALDPVYAEKIGVKTKDLIISQPDTGEQALQLVESFIRTGQISLVVVDSVAALTPKAEIDGEIGDSHIALQARLMSQALRKLTPLAAHNGCTIIFINQIRMKVGVVWGNPETTPGGNALKFYASVRIDVRRKAPMKDGDTIIGNGVRAKIVKNKVAAPFKVAEFEIVYDKGISKHADLINVATQYEVLQRKGAYYYDGETKLGQGISAAKIYLEEDPKATADIRKRVMKKINE